MMLGDSALSGDLIAAVIPPYYILCSLRCEIWSFEWVYKLGGTKEKLIILFRILKQLINAPGERTLLLESILWLSD